MAPDDSQGRAQLVGDVLDEFALEAILFSLSLQGAGQLGGTLPLPRKHLGVFDGDDGLPGQADEKIQIGLLERTVLADSVQHHHAGDLALGEQWSAHDRQGSPETYQSWRRAQVRRRVMNHLCAPGSYDVANYALVQPNRYGFEFFGVLALGDDSAEGLAVRL